MSADIEIRIPKATLKPDLKGRVTKPSIGIYDDAFAKVYTSAVHTDLSATFARIFGEMGERKRQKV